MFFFDFISFDRSFHSQHHILRNIESEISFRVFRSSVSWPILSTLFFDLHSVQYTPFRSLFLIGYPNSSLLSFEKRTTWCIFFSLFRSLIFFHFHHIVIDVVLIFSAPISFTLLNNCAIILFYSSDLFLTFLSVAHDIHYIFLLLVLSLARSIA